MIRKIFTFYIDGFRTMKTGRKLWAIIFIKLFIMFAVLKVFFFPNYLNNNFSNDKQRAEHVLDNITQLPLQTTQRRL